MKAVDTNVLVRLFTNDDEKQARKALEIVRAGPVRVSKTVLLETECVLRLSYELENAVILSAFRGLLSVRTVEVEDRAAVIEALAWLESGLDFADALHLASVGQATAFVTFDRVLARAAKRIEGAPPVEQIAGR